MSLSYAVVRLVRAKGQPGEADGASALLVGQGTESNGVTNLKLNPLSSLVLSVLHSHISCQHLHHLSRAMSTPGCCQLPGSLCDYSGNTESDAPKDSEESDSTMQAQYIAKVTAKDGRSLSTIVKAVSLQSDLGMCRICHEGVGGETLLSPCDCTGTLGKVHRSCLEKWLSSSNTSYCELCHTEFTIERRPQPLTQWLKDPGPRSEKRTLLCDMACFLLITPLAAISGWLCLRGAQDHLQLKSRLEALGLIALTIALFTIYILWTLVSFRYHCQLYSEWRRTNQKVRLLMPDLKGAYATQHSVPTKSTKKMTDETIV